MRIIRNLCRIIVGGVFIVSGFVKAVDPLGSNYKFIDYFNAFGMSWMEFSALFLAFALAFLEFIIGVCLFLNIKIKTASWGALLFMVFFTPLTLVLAIKNPVSDCGCFGDAWILSNWETFFKNVVLLLLAFIVFSNRKRFKSLFYVLDQTVILLVSIGFILYIQLYSYKHLPIIDFRPYAIGKNIMDGMKLPEGENFDEYQITLKYRNKNTGELKEFDESNYPWQDTVNWEFHSSGQKLIKEGYKIPIQNFYIEHPDFGDISEELLEDENYNFLLIAYDLTKSADEYWNKINALAVYAKDKGYGFYGVTASSPEAVNKLKREHKLNFDFCFSDEIQLKTIIRSNPGLVLFKEGTVLNKWAGRDIPKVSDIKNMNLLSYSLTTQNRTSTQYHIIVLALIYLCFLLLFFSKRSKR